MCWPWASVRMRVRAERGDNNDGLDWMVLQRALLHMYIRTRDYGWRTPASTLGNADGESCDVCVDQHCRHDMCERGTHSHID